MSNLFDMPLTPTGDLLMFLFPPVQVVRNALVNSPVSQLEVVFVRVSLIAHKKSF